MIIGLFYNSFRVIIIKRNAEGLKDKTLTLRQYINFSALLIIRHYSSRLRYTFYSFPSFYTSVSFSLSRSFPSYLGDLRGIYHIAFGLSLFVQETNQGFAFASEIILFSSRQGKEIPILYVCVLKVPYSFSLIPICYSTFSARSNIIAVSLLSITFNFI